MKVYLVGGYVRDKLLGRDLSLSDMDYVVVGATPDDLLDKGYIRVGKKFPVFLHPQTNDEYALARKEIKTGNGYKEFDFIFTPDITLEEDLKRRDLTINAIAQDINSGEIYDPYNGRADLDQNVIRHVSNHFSEDPLRVLRAGRFASVLNFQVAPETHDLVKKMIQSGELSFLTSERVLIEIKKVLKKGNIKTFCNYLQKWNVFDELFGNLHSEFQIRHFGNCSNTEKEILFFLNLEKTNLRKYKVTRIVEGSVTKIRNANNHLSEESLCSIDDLYEGVKILGLLKPVLDRATPNHLKCYGLHYDCENFANWLGSLSLFMRDQISTDGMELLNGKGYGDELATRYTMLIKQFQKSNPLK